MLLRHLLLACAACLAFAATAAAARPAACPDGRFLLADGAGLFAPAAAGERQAVTLAGKRLAIDGVCAPAKAKVKAGRRATVIGARWSACGDRKKVQLSGTIASPACDVLRGAVRARKQRPIQLQARRSACGDGVADRAAGETCDLPPDDGGATTTTVPGPGPTTTTLPAPVVTTTTLPGIGPTTTTTTLPGGSGSQPTPASLDAARDAIAAGATDVPLSPDGTLRFRRAATPTGGVDTIVRGATTLVRWVHDGDVTTLTSDDDGDGIVELTAEGRRAPVRGVVVTFDLTGDGAVERTVSMTQVGAAGLSVEITEAGSGTTSFSTTLLQEARGDGVASAAVTSEGCTAGQETAAKTSLDTALAGGLQCLRDLGLDSIAKVLEGKVARDGVTLRCGGTSDCAQIDILDAVTRGALPTSVGITLGQDFLDGTGTCSNGPMILFHELLHMGFGAAHSPFLDRSKFEGLATDTVYSCTDLCFRPMLATKSECARCLGVDRCDPKCGAYDDGPEGACELFVDVTSFTCPVTPCECCKECPPGVRWQPTMEGVARGPVGAILRTNLPPVPDGELTCPDWTPVSCPGVPAGVGLQCCRREPGQPGQTSFVGRDHLPPAAFPIQCVCPNPGPPAGVEMVAQVDAPLGQVEDSVPVTCP